MVGFAAYPFHWNCWSIVCVRGMEACTNLKNGMVDENMRTQFVCYVLFVVFFSRVVNKQEKWFRFMSTISFFCCMLYANQVKPCAAPASKFTGKILRTHSFRVWLFLSSLIFHHSDNNHENKICDLVSLLITWIRIDAWQCGRMKGESTIRK